MSSPTPNLSNLPRHTLSIILAYLQHQHFPNNHIDKDPHNRDAISVLITSQRFAYAILPLFRLPKHLCKIYQCDINDNNYGSNNNQSKVMAVVEKYRFITLPIQDPRTLLDRLNTRRLRRRILWIKNQKLQEQLCYQPGRSTDELALEEWLLTEIHNRDDVNDDEDGNKPYQQWPVHLELLRFVDCVSHEVKYLCHEKQEDLSVPRSKLGFFRSRCRVRKQIDGNFNGPDNSMSLFGTIFERSVTLLSSYPRSGNTLMRSLLERITSTVTGSDTRPDRSLSIKLAQEHDLVGEGLVGKDYGSNINVSNKNCLTGSFRRAMHQTIYDPTVNIVKTHFPERKGWKKVTAQRAILLVRNPYDAIDSYWNLCCTNTHTRSLDESVYEKYSAKFESMARHEITIWCKFHYHWFDVSARDCIPMLIVRYEDLIINTECEMQRVLRFLDSDCENSLASFWKWRISTVVGQSTGAMRSQPIHSDNETHAPSTCLLGSYRPRSSNGGVASIGKSLQKKRYSQSVLWHMHDVAVSMELDRRRNNVISENESTSMTLLQRFGYDIFDQKFPSNFFTSPPILVDALISVGRQKHSCTQINSTSEIRESDDPFGRAMTMWRRGETNGDLTPFPTVSR